MLENRHWKSCELDLLLEIHLERGWMGWSCGEILDERIEKWSLSLSSECVSQK